MLSAIASSLVIACLTFAADVPIQPQAKKLPAELQGVWKLVSIEINEETNNLSKGQPKWIIKENKVRYGGADLAGLTADPSTTPKSIDLAFLDPKAVYEGIWSIEKDTLKICFNGRSEGLKERPQDFSTKDKENMRLLVFEREKAKDGDELSGLNGFVGLVLRTDEETKKIVVDNLIDGSPAKKSGLQKGDVILKSGGAEAKELAAVVDSVRLVKPGREIAFTISRDGKEKDISIKVGVFPFRFLAGLE